MSVALKERRGLENPAIARGDTADVLASILSVDVQLALWQRERPAALEWIDRLDWDDVDDIASSISGPDFRPDIARLLAEAGYSRSLPLISLISEIADIADHFAQVTGSATLRLRLEVIDTDACRKFHMDQVTARLLMPLAGQGTQWIACSEGDQAPINQLACGDVGIFKGRLMVDEPAVLHRSPPVAASGEWRLLLVLDPVPGDCSPEAKIRL